MFRLGNVENLLKLNYHHRGIFSDNADAVFCGAILFPAVLNTHISRGQIDDSHRNQSEKD